MNFIRWRSRSRSPGFFDGGFSRGSSEYWLRSWRPVSNTRTVYSGSRWPGASVCWLSCEEVAVGELWPARPPACLPTTTKRGSFKRTHTHTPSSWAAPLTPERNVLVLLEQPSHCSDFGQMANWSLIFSRSGGEHPGLGDSLHWKENK